MPKQSEQGSQGDGEMERRIADLEALIQQVLDATGGLAVVSNPPVGRQKVLNLYVENGKLKVDFEGE